MTRRPGLVVLAFIGLLTALSTAVITWRSTHQVGAAGGTALPGSTAIQASIVNINGVIPGGRIAGTGMIISADGDVLTNNHVVAGTSSLTAQVGTGRQYHVTVIGVDPSQDVAVVHLDGASRLPAVPIESTGVLSLGDQVTAMGNALGHNGDPVVVTGAVVSLDETLYVLDDGDQAVNMLSGLIQMSAPIQPGDSGGPLLDAAGQVIGMDTAGSPSNGNTGSSVGAAIPIATAVDIAHQITSGATSPYIEGPHSGVLGVAVDVTAKTGDGAHVGSVSGGEAAQAAGIAAGDVITTVRDAPITSAGDFITAMQGSLPGDRVTVGWRDQAGVAHRATVTLSPGPPA